MALIRSSNSALADKQPIRLDLGDLYSQGQRIIAAARAEADKIVADAKAERERLLTDAASLGKEQGTTRGLAEGMAKGQAEGKAAALSEFKPKLDELQSRWIAAFEEFSKRRDDMLLEGKLDVLRLAALVATRVTKRAIALNPSIVTDQLAAALALVSRPSRLVVAVHPDDAPLLRDALPALMDRFTHATHAELAEDTSLSRGSIVLTLASGAVIDAKVESQLDAIVNLLLPSP